MKRAVLLCLSLAALAVPAHADRQAYCQAYARDFADGIAKDKAGWDHKFQIAMTSCMNPKEQTPVPKVKPVIAKAAPAPEPQSPAAVPPAQEEVKAQASAKAEKLTPGSQAFNDYCAKKYTSFDPKTGKYLSHNGVKRPCLVTKDSKG